MDLAEADIPNAIVPPPPAMNPNGSVAAGAIVKTGAATSSFMPGVSLEEHARVMKNYHSCMEMLLISQQNNERAQRGLADAQSRIAGLETRLAFAESNPPLALPPDEALVVLNRRLEASEQSRRELEGILAKSERQRQAAEERLAHSEGLRKAAEDKLLLLEIRQDMTVDLEHLLGTEPIQNVGPPVTAAAAAANRGRPSGVQNKRSADSEQQISPQKPKKRKGESPKRVNGRAKAAKAGAAALEDPPVASQGVPLSSIVGAEVATNAEKVPKANYGPQCNLVANVLATVDAAVAGSRRAGHGFAVTPDIHMPKAKHTATCGIAVIAADPTGKGVQPWREVVRMQRPHLEGDCLPSILAYTTTAGNTACLGIPEHLHEQFATAFEEQIAARLGVRESSSQKPNVAKKAGKKENTLLKSHKKAQEAEGGDNLAVRGKKGKKAPKNAPEDESGDDLGMEGKKGNGALKAQKAQKAQKNVAVVQGGEGSMAAPKKWRKGSLQAQEVDAETESEERTSVDSGAAGKKAKGGRSGKKAAVHTAGEPSSPVNPDCKISRLWTTRKDDREGVDCVRIIQAQWPTVEVVTPLMVDFARTFMKNRLRIGERGKGAEAVVKVPWEYSSLFIDEFYKTFKPMGRKSAGNSPVRNGGGTAKRVPKFGGDVDRSPQRNGGEGSSTDTGEDDEEDDLMIMLDDEADDEGEAGGANGVNEPAGGIPEAPVDNGTAAAAVADLQVIESEVTEKEVRAAESMEVELEPSDEVMDVTISTAAADGGSNDEETKGGLKSPVTADVDNGQAAGTSGGAPWPQEDGHPPAPDEADEAAEGVAHDAVAIASDKEAEGVTLNGVTTGAPPTAVSATPAGDKKFTTVNLESARPKDRVSFMAAFSKGGAARSVRVLSRQEKETDTEGTEC
ncbi:hypothetical protein HK101_008779 [Irineochytrium annulatum]|nr:hypothetical protein HK101_008779 [Irineochytrium annulatum]